MYDAMTRCRKSIDLTNVNEREVPIALEKVQPRELCYRIIFHCDSNSNGNGCDRIDAIQQETYNCTKWHFCSARGNSNRIITTLITEVTMAH